jgi:hypothetical protein
MSNFVRDGHLSESNDFAKIPFLRHVVLGSSSSHKQSHDHSVAGILKGFWASEHGLFKHLRMGLYGFLVGSGCGLFLRGRGFRQHKWVRDMLDYQYYAKGLASPIILQPGYWAAGFAITFSVWMDEAYQTVVGGGHGHGPFWAFSKAPWAGLYAGLAGGVLVHPSFAVYFGLFSTFIVGIYWAFQNYHFN